MISSLKRLRDLVLPAWVKWLACAALCASTFMFGRLQEARRGVDAMNDYMAAQAARAIIIGRAQTKVVIQTEIEYRDRIKEIYLKGEVIEKQVPVYVTSDDNAHFGVNAGFVRSYNAAWSGDTSGPAVDFDREPAGIPLSEIAEVDAHNAAVCLAWREQALGWREFYNRMRSVTAE